MADSGTNIWISSGSAVTVWSQGGPPFPLAPVITNQEITNAAISESLILFGYLSAAVAPGEFLTIPGMRLAPTDLAEVRVLFDGVPAPILSVISFPYSSPPNSDQITAVAPYEISGKATVGVTVEVNGVSSNVSTVAVLPAAPELYTYNLGTLIAASTLNQDGTDNGPGNPAPVGTVVSLFATGAGNMIPPETDGVIVNGPQLPVPALPVSVTMGTRALQVLYAGAAPGLLSGALQVNLLVPNDLVPAPEPNVMDYYLTQLRVAYGQSLAAYVWVKP